jgi:hypothetical protein
LQTVELKMAFGSVMVSVDMIILLLVNARSPDRFAGAVD